MLRRLLTAVLGQVDLILFAPLPQRTLGRLRIPGSTKSWELGVGVWEFT